MTDKYTPVAILSDCGNRYSVSLVEEAQGRQHRVVVDLNDKDGTKEPRIIFSDQFLVNVPEGFVQSYLALQNHDILSPTQKKLFCPTGPVNETCPKSFAKLDAKDSFWNSTVICTEGPRFIIPDSNYDFVKMSAAGTQAKVAFCGSAFKAVEILSAKKPAIFEELYKDIVVPGSAKLECNKLTFEVFIHRKDGVRLTVSARVSVTDGDYEGHPCKVITFSGSGEKFKETFYFSPYKVQYKVAVVEGNVVVSMSILDMTFAVAHLPKDVQEYITHWRGLIPETLRKNHYRFLERLAELSALP